MALILNATQRAKFAIGGKNFTGEKEVNENARGQILRATPLYKAGANVITWNDRRKKENMIHLR